MTSKSAIRDETKSRWHFLLYLISLTLLLSIPLFQPGLITGLDAIFHICRIEGLSESLSAGCGYPTIIYPSYLSGYGYAIGGFYCDLFILPFALLHLMGVSSIFCYKLLVVSILVLSACTAYLASRQMLKSHFAGVFMALAYTGGFYLITNLYFKTAIGEAMAMIFVPLLVGGLYNLTEERFSKPWILVIAFLGFAFSHIISSVLAVVMTVAWCSIRFKKLTAYSQWLTKGLIAFIVFAGLSCFYWLGFIELYASNDFYFEKNPLRAQHHVFNLLSTAANITPFTFGFSGILIVIITPLTAFMFFRNGTFQKEAKKALGLWTVAILIILLCFYKDFWVWYDENTPIYIQAPCRLNIFSHFFLYLSAAVLLVKLKNMQKYCIPILFLFCFAHVLIVWKVALKDYSLTYDDPSLASIESIENQVSFGKEWLPLKVDDKFIYHFIPASYTSNNGIKGCGRYAEHGDLYFPHDGKSSSYEVGKIWYKGYHADLKTKEGSVHTLRISESPKGLALVQLEKGLKEGEIRVYYKGTIAQKIGRWISVLTILLLLIYLYCSTRRARAQGAALAEE